MLGVRHEWFHEAYPFRNDLKRIPSRLLFFAEGQVGGTVKRVIRSACMGTGTFSSGCWWVACETRARPRSAAWLRQANPATFRGTEGAHSHVVFALVLEASCTGGTMHLPRRGQELVGHDRSSRALLPRAQLKTVWRQYSASRSGGIAMAHVACLRSVRVAADADGAVLAVVWWVLEKTRGEHHPASALEVAVRMGTGGEAASGEEVRMSRQRFFQRQGLIPAKSRLPHLQVSWYVHACARQDARARKSTRVQRRHWHDRRTTAASCCMCVSRPLSGQRWQH